MIKTDISFSIGGKQVSFSVWHDLPDTPALRIEDAVNNWVFRTDRFTAKSLAEYINSKKPGMFASLRKRKPGERLRPRRIKRSLQPGRGK